MKLKPISPTTPIKAPTEVATVASTETLPVPLPRDARPKATAVASLPAAEKPLIVDENKVRQQENAAVEPFPLSDDEVVTGDQLEEWDSGSLADYLERKGLLSQTSAEDGYDPDGFFLDEGPNKKKKPRTGRRLLLFLHRGRLTRRPDLSRGRRMQSRRMSHGYEIPVRAAIVRRDRRGICRSGNVLVPSLGRLRNALACGLDHRTPSIPTPGCWVARRRVQRWR